MPDDGFPSPKPDPGFPRWPLRHCDPSDRTRQSAIHLRVRCRQHEERAPQLTQGNDIDPQTVERAIERCIDVSTRLGALEDESHPRPARSSPCAWTTSEKMQRWLEARERRHGRLGRRPLRSLGTSRFAAIALNRRLGSMGGMRVEPPRAFVGATTPVALAAAFAGINAGCKQAQLPWHRRLASRAGRYALAILSRPREAAISAGNCASISGACPPRLRQSAWPPSPNSTVASSRQMKITDGNRALA